MKKKILLGVFGALFLISGVALAYTTADDPICAQPLHSGYSYSGTGTPPADFNPAEPLPSGLTSLGQFKVNFDCEEDQNQRCHWAFIPSSNPNQNGTWVECSGAYQEMD